MNRPTCEQCGRSWRDLAAKNFSETPCGEILCDWCYPVHVESCEFCTDEANEVEA